MPQPLTRAQQFTALFPNQPAFRLKQLEQACFVPSVKGWMDVTAFSPIMRETMESSCPWMSVKEDIVLSNRKKDTFKALLLLADGERIETVLMKNKRGYWTICVSSQVGCAMRCGFCATGRMGLKRSLTSDEIVDQYRFWAQYVVAHQFDQTLITNIVYMGMGEPLANYETVKDSLRRILANTDIGVTHITVSTVGVLPRLEQILTDADWPHVRLAVSLHSADPVTRKHIVPTSSDAFLPTLADWARRYLQKFGNKRHHLTFEYVMLKGVNDSDEHARLLADFSSKAGHVKVNLIPYNLTENVFTCAPDDRFASFLRILEHHGVTVTIRKTMGEDIAAACGQLVVKK